MKRSSTIFLQTVVVLAGIGALALLLWEPHLEGRNVNATLIFVSVVIATSTAVFERRIASYRPR